MIRSNNKAQSFAFLEESLQELILQFLAELMRATANVKNQDTFQQVLQTYCDDLRPWLEQSDYPPNPRAVFSLLDNYTIDAMGENITVVLSPEADAFFCAWLRRNKVLSEGGLNTAHAWSN